VSPNFAFASPTVIQNPSDGVTSGLVMVHITHAAGVLEDQLTIIVRVFAEMYAAARLGNLGQPSLPFVKQAWGSRSRSRAHPRPTMSADVPL
jgi:hypothetical protein